VTADVRPPAAELAEIGCGALVSCLGLAVDYPKSGNGRSPDLVVVDRSAVVADIEVVCAQQRSIHADELVTQRNLSEAIGTRMDAHVAIFIADELSGDLVDEIVNGVIHVPIGGAIEKEGKWCVVARALPDRKPFEGGSRQEIAPGWWPLAGAQTVVQTVRLGPESPILTVVCKTVEASYLNPIRRKAERPQRTGNLPYVIAVDVDALPDAFEEIPKELAGFWAQWKHVSAVLLFFSYQGVGLNGWWCSIVRNPFADVVLPQDMLSDLSEHKTEVVVIS
jgi:hypothetical protein